MGVWDDHDYGINNGGKFYTHKSESQKLFLDFMGDPPNSVRRSRAGVYMSQVYGPPGKQVKVCPGMIID